ncbi:glucose-6-phosphate isomerase [Candidatus Saccharibacteria bacterium]|nr:glucose-6-phosphate isomerase [Candidatus Saccharibacteria bacterium]
MTDIDLDYDLAQEIIDEIKTDPMGGWLSLPDTPAEDIDKIKALAKTVRNSSDFLVCIGIGGSYLGTRAIYEALDLDSTAKCRLLFAGNSLSSRELKKLLHLLDGHDFSLNVISKSGTTLEPALAFRILKAALVKKYGKDGARQRIIATTDPSAGALREEATAEGYQTFAIANGIGGRYSVLSPVGLFPLAVAGCNIEKLLMGARECRETQLDCDDLKHSMLVEYAFSRFYLYDELGCDVEVLASFEPSLLYFNEWWKQLFGESEGKDHRGIFPASVIYSTDLHSLGQYLQDGRRNIFETFLRFSPETGSLTVPKLDNATDGLDYLEGRSLTEISNKALDATLKAHDAGGISTFEIAVLDDETTTGISERSLGFLIFFFEVACALSATLLGVDPFDQPGVEKYKKEMFKLLGKPSKTA